MKIDRSEILMPGGIELTHIVENKEIFDSSMTMLSIGYGTGEIECYLAEKYNIQVTGIDISKDFMVRAHKKSEILKLLDRVQFKIGNGTNLEFQDQSFDIVYCMGSIIDFLEQGLSEMYRILKPTGKAIIGEVLWLENEIPSEIRNFWEKGISIFNEKDYKEIITSKGFQLLFFKSFQEPDWWKNYYKDRGKTSHWVKEEEMYNKSKNFLGIGLFILTR
jgi:ubiquinone/menaquinone biosynthesis C-methylase UbiE